MRLNPCFSGNRFGSAINNIIDALIMSEVLILVLVEIGLGECEQEMVSYDNRQS